MTIISMQIPIRCKNCNEWQTPWNFNDIQRFLGLVQYLAQFMPNVSAYTSQLSGIMHKNLSFMWTALHDKYFESIKALIIQTPISKPIDPNESDPIWIVCYASASGIGTF
jgi:hypothetical protein